MSGLEKMRTFSGNAVIQSHHTGEIGRAALRPGGYVRVWIGSPYGVGDEEIPSRLFDALYTVIGEDVGPDGGLRRAG